MPIVKTAVAIKPLASGDVLEVLATDPGSVKDFDAWSKVTGNELIESDVGRTSAPGCDEPTSRCQTGPSI